jgi:hypothetical protein
MHEEKPKRPVGRPSFKKGKAKSEILKMRVLPREKAIYERAAKAAGASDLSAWVRETLNRCVGEPRE